MTIIHKSAQRVNTIYQNNFVHIIFESSSSLNLVIRMIHRAGTTKIATDKGHTI